MKDRAILAPLNKDVDKINNDIVAKLPGEYKIYYSNDSVKDQHEGALEFTTEFLNSVNISDLPPHELKLKKKSLIMLLRNLDVSEDALENVSDNEEDYRERLICILPPPVDPDCLTDEDSGEEDNVTLNNLPRNILLQPAEAYLHGENGLGKNPVNWPDVQGACQDKRPIEWFENFLDEDVISLLVSESNKYAVKKNLPGDITTEDMKCFIGILLVSGYSWLPVKNVLKTPDTKNELISSAMTRDRFDFIFRHLHVNDNLDLQDKYTKVRPLVTLLNKKFLEFSPLEEHYSVDEAMIPYYGRHGCKQHIKGKPIRYGFKAWVGATRLGIASNAVGINPKQSAKRFSQSEKRNIVIEEPHMVSIYNKYMGGVDRSDENISHYRIGIRGKKWYMPLLTHMIDLAEHNAWQLYKINHGKLDHLGFRRVAIALIESNRKMPKRA
ncbi:PiggyBac transposable element-derived protein 3 [Eumeta japonica]|uniref:PiggyBac transposable element-derived protein 3 n=1 Tax=Eumeta variegata TaxID=151549 RepID=A0A4C1XCX8_EUMVA|nr:PiggyBac transposable element-derived protein 3 [Eumeta japonica]